MHWLSLWRVRWLVACVLAMCLALPLAWPAASASPEESLPAGVAAVLRARGVMNGDPDGSFRWDEPLSRAEALKVVVAVVRNAPESRRVQIGLPFDVPADAWYASYVRYGLETGLVKGYGDGSFRPHAPISMAEYAVLYARVARSLGESPRETSGFEGLKPLWAIGEIGGYRPLCEWLAIASGSSVDLGYVISRAEAGLLAYEAMAEFGLLFDLEGKVAAYDEDAGVIILSIGAGHSVRVEVTESSIVMGIHGDALSPGDLNVDDPVGAVLDAGGEAAVVIRK
ncbi:MAG: S-layer homology domain-containing protein [Bacillota bacterium]